MIAVFRPFFTLREPFGLADRSEPRETGVERMPKRSIADRLPIIEARPQ
jgi:hypothetical protein